MNKTVVVMSTYCGEKYLHQQIMSIFDQHDTDVYLMVRDDASKDNTAEILDKIQRQHPDHMLWYSGKNLGVGNSFMDCLYTACEQFSDADYYAFADQDDVWLDSKLSRGIMFLKNTQSSKALYASNQIVTDGELNRQGLRFDYTPDLGYGQILRGNEISGCTFLMTSELAHFLAAEENRPSRELLRSRIHDVWVAEVASLFGKTIYDPEGFILYRQHGDNLVGALERNIPAMMIRRIKNLFSSDVSDGSIQMADELLKLFGNQLGEKEENIRQYSRYRKELKAKRAVMRNGVVFQHSSESNMKYLLRTLFNKL